MPGGRPTEYKPEYCEKIIELGRNGFSKAQMAAELGVCRNTLDAWCRSHEEFLRAFARACDYSLAYWENLALKNLENRNFQVHLWTRSMAARFPDDYTEKKQQEISGPGGSPLQFEARAIANKSTAELIAERQALLALEDQSQPTQEHENEHQNTATLE